MSEGYEHHRMRTQTQGGPLDECLRGECCHCVVSEDVSSGRLLSRAALHPQELCNVHVEKKDVHIDSRTSRAMGRQGGGAQAPPRGRAALQHAARVAVSVSKLAPPSPPSQEAALWVIASCDTLSHAPDYPGNVPANNLRETCEAVKEAVEQVNHCASSNAYRRCA